MTLNKQKGNMYPFVTHTWNPIKGKCSHDCSYCFMKVYKQNPLHFVEKELEDDLGDGNYIFVGSSTDMFAKNVPSEWIMEVLDKCMHYGKNTYLFQSKNPARFFDFLTSFPIKTILGTTLETNRNMHVSKAPSTTERSVVMHSISSFEKMVSIEPIMKFDIEEFVMMIRGCKPKFVSIGADSKGHHLPEPNWKEVCGLIRELEKFTEVREKSNLNRLKEG